LSQKQDTTNARLTLDPKKKTHIRCSRFRSAGESKRALALADESLLDIKATQWFKGAKAFAEKAVAAGSARAAFFVGSVAFYCEGSDGFLETSHEDTHNDAQRCSSETEEERRRDARRARGASLLARAATAGVKEAHHTLAVMHFNGSGGRRRDKDPEAGAALCARGNILFDCVSAKRELGHCLQDGFGVEQDSVLGAEASERGGGDGRARGERVGRRRRRGVARGGCRGGAPAQAQRHQHAQRGGRGGGGGCRGGEDRRAGTPHGDLREPVLTGLVRGRRR
jgi:TPR repeat protein